MIAKKQAHKNTDRFLVLSAIIYVAVVTSIVAYFWMRNIHLFDLSLTVSLYVALLPGTAIIYFVGAAIICTALFLYMIQTRLASCRRSFTPLSSFVSLRVPASRATATAVYWPLISTTFLHMLWFF